MNETKKTVELTINLLTNGQDYTYVNGINKILKYTTATGVVV